MTHIESARAGDAGAAKAGEHFTPEHSQDRRALQDSTEIGSARFDRMVEQLHRLGQVDLTADFPVIHQNHDYGHLPTAQIAEIRGGHSGSEADWNRSLYDAALGWFEKGWIYSVEDSTYALKEGRLHPLPAWKRRWVRRRRAIAHRLKQRTPGLYRLLHQCWKRCV